MQEEERKKNETMSTPRVMSLWWLLVRSAFELPACIVIDALQKWLNIGLEQGNLRRSAKRADDISGGNFKRTASRVYISTVSAIFVHAESPFAARASSPPTVTSNSKRKPMNYPGVWQRALVGGGWFLRNRRRMGGAGSTSSMPLPLAISLLIFLCLCVSFSLCLCPFVRLCVSRT